MGCTRLPKGQLHWDGQFWSLEQAGQTQLQSVGVIFDANSVLLLRLEGLLERKVRWLWIDKAAAQPNWLDLRRALYAAAPKEVKHDRENSDS